MKKVISCILVWAIFLSITLFPVKTKAENSFMIGNIQNAAVGSYVSLGGRTWRLIGDNYIILNQSISTMALAKNNYATYASSDIRNYLNNTFLNSFGSSKRLITNTEWGMGEQSAEYDYIVKDMISLPSYSDMKIVQNVLNLKSGIIWTRTQDYGSKDNKFWVLNASKSSLIRQIYSDKADVYPVLTIAPNIVITGRGTERNPYVVKEISGQSDSTRVVGVKTNLTSIKMSVGQDFNLITLFVYADGSLKQIINPAKYLYDRSNKNNDNSTKYNTIVTGDKITYSSSNTNVAEVSAIGYIHAKSAGTAIITVKGLGWTTKAVVTIK